MEADTGMNIDDFGNPGEVTNINFSDLMNQADSVTNGVVPATRRKPSPDVYIDEIQRKAAHSAPSSLLIACSVCDTGFNLFHDDEGRPPFLIIPPHASSREKTCSGAGMEGRSVTVGMDAKVFNAAIRTIRAVLGRKKVA